MPNGRSGGFPISIADLKELVASLADDAIVGVFFSQSERAGGRPIDRSEALRAVAGRSEERAAVEEQDHAYYLVHLSDAPLAWILVSQDSPIFEGLRAHHAKWKVDHPNWRGWIGF